MNGVRKRDSHDLRVYLAWLNGRGNEAFVALFGESWRERPAQSGEYGYVRTDTVAEMQAMLEAAGFEVEVDADVNADVRSEVTAGGP